MMKKNNFREEYCRYLYGTQTNYTLTYAADHQQKVSHDTWKRKLEALDVQPSDLWDVVKNDIEKAEKMYLIFDDTVLNKNSSKKIEMARSQYSGNEHKVIRGIGVVNCVLVNPQTEESWAIDYRYFDPSNDGKTKIMHLLEMLEDAIEKKGLPVEVVLMDTWYATQEVMLKVEDYGVKYVCPVKKNRLVKRSVRQEKYGRIEELKWNDGDLESGNKVHLRGFPAGHEVRLFCFTVFTNRTEYVVTNLFDEKMDKKEAAKLCGVRWKIEEYHREKKQLTGIEKCQCRKRVSQRNHIGCGILLLALMKRWAKKVEKNVYQLKKELLNDYMKNIFKQPFNFISFA